MTPKVGKTLFFYGSWVRIEVRPISIDWRFLLQPLHITYSFATWGDLNQFGYFFTTCDGLNQLGSSPLQEGIPLQLAIHPSKVSAGIETTRSHPTHRPILPTAPPL